MLSGVTRSISAETGKELRVVRLNTLNREKNVIECGLRILASHWKQSPPSVISKESFVKKVEDRGMKEDMEYDMEQGVLRTQPAPGGSVYVIFSSR